MTVPFKLPLVAVLLFTGLGRCAHELNGRVVLDGRLRVLRLVHHELLKAMVVGYYRYLFRKDMIELEFPAWMQDHVEEHKYDQWCMPEDHQSAAKR
jgi:hypothetical protein